MIIVRGLKLVPGEAEEKLTGLAAKKLHTDPARLSGLKIRKKALDARKKDDIHYVYNVTVKADHEDRLLKHMKANEAAPYKEWAYEIPAVKRPPEGERPVIVGFGPAGMFAALVLAYAGACPIVLERGRDADARLAAVESFRAGGAFDPESNVQFGEGGAGTFSDGKLNTGTNDPRLEWVLQQFAAHGAKASVVYDAKPHIGTDVLVGVVKAIREDVIRHGGEVHFASRMDHLVISDGHLTGAAVLHDGKEEIIPCRRLILATGHSARDTFETLLAQGVPMSPKPFSMGVRIEQKQKAVNIAQYGAEHPELPAADYSLNVHLPDGTSAYTFCMCPGGQVFAAASEAGGVVTNGMSYSRRDGENANAALLVTLHPEDFPDDRVLSGMYWQREIEQAAYHYGGDNYCAPAQLVGDFLKDSPSSGPRSVLPTYRPGVVWGDLREVLPPRITGVLKKALPELGKKMHGFDDDDAVMTAPETRSSSPVRIERGKELSSVIEGLYPCGEGAGYAGGISSAAVDGMRCAEAVLKLLAAENQ